MARCADVKKLTLSIDVYVRRVGLKYPSCRAQVRRSAASARGHAKEGSLAASRAAVPQVPPSNTQRLGTHVITFTQVRKLVSEKLFMAMQVHELCAEASADRISSLLTDTDWCVGSRKRRDSYLQARRR